MRIGFPSGLLSRIRTPGTQNAVLFFGAFALFSFIVSFFHAAFFSSQGTSFDSSSIDHRETAYLSGSKRIFEFDELEPKESAPPESPVENAPEPAVPKKKAAPSKIMFAFRPDAVKVDETLVNLLRANLNARAFREKVTPISVIVDSERVQPRGQLAGNELIIATSIEGESEKIKVFVHELGHVVDIHYLKPGVFGDVSDEFYAISWDSYKVKKKGAKLADFVSGYALSNKYEDFAESFSFFVFHNSEFYERAKKNAPLAKKYEFFAKKIFEEGEFIGTNFSSSPLKSYFWDTTKVAMDSKKYLFYIR